MKTEIIRTSGSDNKGEQYLALCRELVGKAQELAGTSTFLGRMVDDVLGKTAVHHVEKALSAVGGHGDHVRIDAPGEVEDALLDAEVVVDGGRELAQFMPLQEQVDGAAAVLAPFKILGRVHLHQVDARVP